MESRDRFEGLYRAYAGVVRAYAWRRSDGGTAEDVVSEVFLVAWRRLGEIPDDPLPWLLGVARRVLANRRRGAARAVALEDRVAAASRGSADADELSVALDPRIEAALLALGDRDREVLLLVAWEELSPAQAARVLGIRTGTFSVRLHRARRRFANALAADGGGSVEQRSALEVM